MRSMAVKMTVQYSVRLEVAGTVPKLAVEVPTSSLS